MLGKPNEMPLASSERVQFRETLSTFDTPETPSNEGKAAACITHGGAILYTSGRFPRSYKK